MSEEPEMTSAHGHLKIFTGNSNPQLAELVAEHLSVPVAKARVGKFANQETSVEVLDSVRMADVFIMQSGCGSVNDMCMEMFILINACKIACASRVVGVLPYFPYSKQSKQKKRGAIPAKLMATLLKVAGVTQVLTMDLHHMQMQGFFDCPVDNVKLSPLLSSWIKEEVNDYQQAVIVAKNAGASKRAALIAKRLRLDFALIFGEQTRFAEALSEERLGTDGSADAASEEVQGEDPQLMGGADEDSYGNSVVGSVDGRIVIVIDDLIDTAHPFVLAANLLKRNNAAKIYVLATHGIFSGTAAEDFQACADIDHLVVTNTIPQHEKQARCAKLRVIDCSAVLAETIRRIHNDESMSNLYTHE
eukprot:m.20741 g.20741  ORF g.20741 m.20741 type:complete len:361 (-) comp10613_c0_seq1:79-1161(-)